MLHIRGPQEAEVGFNDFIVRAYELTRLIKEVRHSTSAKILTCEDGLVYHFSSVSIVTEEVSEMLNLRKEYPLVAFTRDVWERSHKCELFIHDSSDDAPFMVHMECDRHGDKERLIFYGQGLCDEVREILNTFAATSPDWVVGDGWSKPSLFNWGYIRRHNAIRSI